HKKTCEKPKNGSKKKKKKKKDGRHDPRPKTGNHGTTQNPSKTQSHQTPPGDPNHAHTHTGGTGLAIIKK
ncbi:hypothetical protein Uis1B_1011, partial [Bifidobacterium margollesii]